MADLQIILGFGNADVDGLGGTVGVLALRFVEHHEADAVHAVQAGFCCGRERDFVGACPSFAVVGTLVKALGAATAEDDVSLVGVHGELLAGLAAHAVTVGEHFHIASVPGGAEVFTAEHGRAALAKIAGSCQHVNALGVVGVESESFGAVKTLVVFRDEVHQWNPGFVFKVKAVNAAHVGAGVQDVFSLRVEHYSGNESAAVKAHVAPFVLFGAYVCGKCGQGGDADY